METAFSRDVIAIDIPPYSYTAVAHTFKNSPFNEYPFAMARLRWFTDALEASPDLSSENKAVLLGKSEQNSRFRYLQVSDAGTIDRALDEIHIEAKGFPRSARDAGPHEPGLGRWVPEDEFNERCTIELPAGADRPLVFDRVRAKIMARGTPELAIDQIYLYPPRYGDEPGGRVEHSFRVFGHTDSDDRATAQRRLHHAVEAVLQDADTCVIRVDHLSSRA